MKTEEWKTSIYASPKGSGVTGYIKGSNGWQYYFKEWSKINVAGMDPSCNEGNARYQVNPETGLTKNTEIVAVYSTHPSQPDLIVRKDKNNMVIPETLVFEDLGNGNYSYKQYESTGRAEGVFYEFETDDDDEDDVKKNLNRFQL